MGFTESERRHSSRNVTIFRLIGTPPRDDSIGFIGEACESKHIKSSPFPNGVLSDAEEFLIDFVAFQNSFVLDGMFIRLGHFDELISVNIAIR